MSRPLHRDPLLDPAQLDRAARDRLTDELYVVQQAVFAEVSKDEFRRYVVDSPAVRTRIAVYRDDTGRAVGFAAFHVFAVPQGGRTVDVMRAEVGLLPAYRGRSAASGLLVREALAAIWRHPTRTRVFVASPVHPASYLAFSRIAAAYPRPDRPTPAALQALMDSLDGPLGLDRPERAGVHVRKVGWITRQSPAEAAMWAAHPSPLVRYYLDENPHYTEGHGLRILMQVSLLRVLQGCARLAAQAWRRRWRARPAPAPATAPTGAAA